MYLNKLIDHTNLDPFATPLQIKALCDEAIRYFFCAVCVSPYHLPLAHEKTKNSSVSLATVVGFPYGYNSTTSKMADVIHSLEFADEYDIVVNMQALLKDDWRRIEHEMHFITNSIHNKGKIVKWIVESALISKAQLMRLCEIANTYRIDFMKTSTGVNGPGARITDVEFMRTYLDPEIKIKASGGIRTKEQALELIKAGADRIGASGSVELVR